MKFPSLTTIGHWLDENGLIILAGFLMAFIPLYPKLPLFEAIPGYIVRVRLEDILIFVTLLVWLVQVIRKKIKWRTPFFWLITAYAVVGFLSVLSAVFITKTVPFELLHIGKTVLHYVRYLEYFSLFFIIFGAVKTKQHIKLLLAVIVTTVFVVALYGYGQKEYYWPVYSTMNREFSKGVRLYLTEHARVQSTFGGHYDLSAYLVVMLPLILSLAFSFKKRLLKVLFHTVHLAGIWLLVVSASRTSFVAYLVGMTCVIALFAWQKTNWFSKFWWGSSRFLLMSMAVGIMMINFGEDIYQRLLQVVDGYPAISQVYHSLNHQRKVLLHEPSQLFAQVFQLPEPQKPPNSISTAEAEQSVLVSSDERPVTVRPSDVYVDVPDIVEVATISASGAATTILVDRGPRTYSECALEKGLSLCIRLDTLWPRAIAGFYRNPLLGTGYATLTKEVVEQFTEAESTDNNFLRTLGETGLLGFITFYGVVILGSYYAWKLFLSKDKLGLTLAIGFLSATVGLLINAVYIDVFAASKVAFSYWGLAGLVMAYAWQLADRKALTTPATRTITPAVSSKKNTDQVAQPKKKHTFKNKHV